MRLRARVPDVVAVRQVEAGHAVGAVVDPRVADHGVLDATERERGTDLDAGAVR